MGDWVGGWIDVESVLCLANSKEIMLNRWNEQEENYFKELAIDSGELNKSIP